MSGVTHLQLLVSLSPTAPSLAVPAPVSPSPAVPAPVSLSPGARAPAAPTWRPNRRQLSGRHMQNKLRRTEGNVAAGKQNGKQPRHRSKERTKQRPMAAFRF